MRCCTIEINSAASQITLHFTGALNAASAGVPSNYTVLVNNQEVTVINAVYNAGNNEVTLSLTQNSFGPGDSLTVMCEVLDAASQMCLQRSGPFVVR